VIRRDASRGDELPRLSLCLSVSSGLANCALATVWRQQRYPRHCGAD